MDSFYDDHESVTERILRGRHRAVIGGQWDELGVLQFEFMVAQGLRPEHVLLDIGCGALRGGVRFIPYLNPGNYWGIDKNDMLLKVGYDLELKRYHLADRQPRDQLVCLPDFEFDRLGAQFDVAIAQSLFTHLSLNRIRRCLARLAPSLRTGARLYATFFEVASGEDRELLQHRAGDTVSYSDQAFYHYSQRDLQFATEGLPYAFQPIGEWGHPRGQHIAAFEKCDTPPVS